MSVRESYQKHKGRSWLVGIAIVAALVALYVMKTRTPTIRYINMPVRRGNITASVQATGTINPLTTVPVGSYVSGTVEYIFADFNTRVHNGQVLAQIDPAIYEAQVDTARGNLQNAQSNLVTLAATVQVDEANLAKSE